MPSLLYLEGLINQLVLSRETGIVSIAELRLEIKYSSIKHVFFQANRPTHKKDVFELELVMRVKHPPTIHRIDAKDLRKVSEGENALFGGGRRIVGWNNKDNSESEVGAIIAYSSLIMLNFSDITGEEQWFCRYQYVITPADFVQFSGVVRSKITNQSALSQLGLPRWPLTAARVDYNQHVKLYCQPARLHPTHHEMLASLEVQQLVEETKISRVLQGGLLPLNNNKCYFNLAGVHSVVVVGNDSAGCIAPVGLGVFNRCSTNQLYCSLAVTSAEYDGVYVNIEKMKVEQEDIGIVESDEDKDEHTPGPHSVYRISEVLEDLPDLSGLPQYYSAFCEPDARPLLQCMIDELVEKTVGHIDFEMTKNITVDLYDDKGGYSEHADELWRDYSGFIVGDRFRYCEVEIPRGDFLSRLEATPRCTMTAAELTFTTRTITKEDFDLVVEYDQTLTLSNREAHLEYLLDTCGVSGSIAIDAHQQPVGYILSLGGHILQCYAEDQGVANCLLYAHVKESMAAETRISAFMRFDKLWLAEDLAEKAVRVRRVRRFHTRILPNIVKDHRKIFAYNMGVHLF